MNLDGVVTAWLQQVVDRLDINDIFVRDFRAFCLDLARTQARSDLISFLESTHADVDEFVRVLRHCVDSHKERAELEFAAGGACPLVRFVAGDIVSVFHPHFSSSFQCWRARMQSGIDMAPNHDRVKVVVVGYGTAGKARVRDALGLSAHFEFAGLISRRSQDAISPIRTWEEILSMRHPDGNRIHAVAICTENQLHFSQVKESLEHGYNVLVEYPPAMSLLQWHQLVKIAEEKRLVLHVEWMALYSAGQKLLKGQLSRVGSPIKTATLHLSSGWTASSLEQPFEATGSPAFAGISRIVRVLDLFGPVSVASSEVTLHEGMNENSTKFCAGYTLRTTFVTTSDPNPVTVVWIEEKKIGLKRNTVFEATCENGEKVYEEPTHAGWQPWSLFTYDISLFAHALAGETSATATLARNNDLTATAFSVAEKIDEVIQSSR